VEEKFQIILLFDVDMAVLSVFQQKKGLGSVGVQMHTQIS